MNKTTKKVRLDVDGVVVHAKECGVNTKWYEISRAMATKLAGGRVPKMGYEIDVRRGEMPSGRRMRGGMWVLSNRSGKFELHFVYG